MDELMRRLHQTGACLATARWQAASAPPDTGDDAASPADGENSAV
ncbi:hypothetical protein ACQP25_44785 (plasmid) [Microtetraspora malaysiensis]